jgi:dienelactone hydrolase
VAVRRGYIGCVYAGADLKDDTDAYADIWYPKYDFTRLMRRAWAAHRVIDYLHMLPIVDTNCIGLTGHSRNGKQSLMAAAFDERIKAVIPSSGGTGAEDPFRYTSEEFDNETIVGITTNFPHWLHPRLRFFIGREHKLPVDQNLMMALIAPRALMLSTATTEHQGNPWGIEQCYRSVQRVYKFLGAEDKLSIRLRPGRHDTAARDIEAYVDFFDYVFGRTDIKPPQKLYYDYTFSKWLGISGERIDPLTFPSKGLDDLLVKQKGGEVKTVAGWQTKKHHIKHRIHWGLGDEPAGATNPGPKSIARIPHRDNAYSGDHIARVIGRPEAGKNVGRLVISHYNGFGDYLDGNLYYPADDKGQPVNNNLPVVIFLHQYEYPTGFGDDSDIMNGFVKRGFAVFMFDQIGFGTRVEEGTLFYQRYPHWSKLGRMVADTKAAVDMLANLEIINADRIYAAGCSLGGMVGLYTAALDQRIAGMVCVDGFTPMRLDTADKGTSGIRRYSHLHGLLPRLGFFVDNESRIPYDFHELLACVAPRPVLVVAAKWNRFATFDDVSQCVGRAGRIYQLLDADDRLQLYAPESYTSFELMTWRLKLSGQVQQKLFEWVLENFK